MGVRGVRPPDLPHYTKPSPTSANHYATNCFLFYMSKHLYLSLVIVLNGKGAGRGLAPTHGSIEQHITVYYHCNDRARIVYHIYNIYTIV
jgi:hypothetical protein